MEDKVLFSQQS